MAEAAELNVVRAVVLMRNGTLLGGVAISVSVPISPNQKQFDLSKFTWIVPIENGWARTSSSAAAFELADGRTAVGSHPHN